MSRLLMPEALTAAVFAPFGEVIAAADKPDIINTGATYKSADLARIDTRGGRPAVHLYRSTPPSYPFALRMMERHPLGSQLFMPLGPNPFLVVVAPAGTFDAAAIRAFAAGPGQGVNLAPGTWHHFNLALRGVSDFLVIDREGPGENCDEITLDGSILVADPEAHR